MLWTLFPSVSPPAVPVLIAVVAAPFAARLAVTAAAPGSEAPDVAR